MKMTTMAVMAVLLLSGLSVLAQEITNCKHDGECPGTKFCYSSGSCVNFTDCNRYNRQEVPGEPARDVSRCGPCNSGYISETLGSKDNEGSCKKKPDDEVINNGISTEAIISSVVVCVVIATVIFVGYICYRKKFRRTNVVDKNSRELDTMLSGRPEEEHQNCRGIICEGPSAPPLSPEQDSFSENEHPPPYTPTMNNNKIIKDRNTTVQAVPFKEPDWVELDSRYQGDQNDDNYDEYGPPNSPQPPLPDEDTSPSTWVPQQSTGQVSSRPFAQFGMGEAERDNAVNNALAQGSCPPLVSTITQQATQPVNSTNPTARNGTQQPNDSGNHAGGLTIINQINVTMNSDVNFSNDDR